MRGFGLRRVLFSILIGGALATPATEAAPGDRHVFASAVRSGVTHPLWMAMAPDGAHVYVVSRHKQNTNRDLLVLQRDPTTGQLGNAQLFPVDSRHVRLAVSGDGAHLYATRQSSLDVYARDILTGAITLLETHVNGGGGVTGLGTAIEIALSPDDANVYVASHGDDGIAVFARDPGTGLLAFLESHRDGVGGVDGLEQAASVLVSPDGAHVYVGGRNTDGIGAFARSAVDGRLTFVQHYQHPVANSSQSQWLAMPADGGQLYVARSDAVMTVLTRDAGTGALALLEEHALNSGPRAAAVSASGEYVYAAANDSLFVFRRDAIAGTLAFLEQLDGGAGGGDWLNDVYDLVVAPDAEHVYAGGFWGDAVTQFRPLAIECSAIPAGGCRTPVKTTGSRLVVKQGSSDAKDQITFKWGSGEATDVADFGDPVSTLDDYALCIYDGSPGTPLLTEAVMRAAGGCPTKPCWKATSKGPKFRDKARLPHGVIGLKLKAGTAGTAVLITKLKGERTPTPFLPATVPLTVQVQTAHGACWEAVFATALVNSTELFKSILVTGP